MLLSKNKIKHILTPFIVLFLLSNLLIYWSTDNSSVYAAESISPTVAYQAHVSDIGWQNEVFDGLIAGTTGKGKPIEAINFKLKNADGSIVYQAYVNSLGWRSEVSDGQNAGTTGHALSMRGIKIHLTGNIAGSYNIYYRTHLSDIGWTGWVSNDATSGTLNKNIEAIQVLLLAKGISMPSNTVTTTAPVTTKSSSHISNIGWQEYATGTGISGIPGGSNNIEAFKVYVSNNSGVGIRYSTYVHSSGWQDFVKNNEQSGTTGAVLSTEGIKMTLYGYLADNYNIYYRTYVAGAGWQPWVSNGAVSGNPGTNKALQGVQISVLPKSSSAPSDATPIQSLTPIGLEYVAHVQDIGWQNTFYNSQTMGTTGQGKRMEAACIAVKGDANLGISYTTHVQDLGWGSYASNGNITGTVGMKKQIEAIRIKLTGSDASKFDIYYRSHVATLGWLGWTKNDGISGTTGLAHQMEALQILIVPAGSAAPGATGNSYVQKTTKGIDVSKWQGNIDWNKVAASGVSFAMVRATYGDQQDPFYRVNILNANKAGIYTGVYCYSYATSIADAQKEANTTINALKGLNIRYPIAYDIEDADTLGTLTTAQRTDIILEYKRIVESNGYKFMLYANLDWLKNKIDMSRLRDVDLWVARYPNVVDFEAGCGYNSPKVTMWQYCSDGTCPGINGNVDMNVGYRTY